MDKLIEKFQNWTYLETLPNRLHGFSLNVEQRLDGVQYLLFSYYSEELDKHFSVFYDKATKEYIARWRHGLIEFCDVNFISPNLETLEKLLVNRLQDAICCMAEFKPETLGSIFLGKKILEWPYACSLATDIQGFVLKINPTRPLKGINGSFIIIDYCNFSERTNLLVYYNIYRDEFYGELIFRSTPEMTTLFDSKTLPELEEKLKTNLEPAISDLRRRLTSESNG